MMLSSTDDSRLSTEPCDRCSHRRMPQRLRVSDGECGVYVAVCDAMRCGAQRDDSTRNADEVDDEVRKWEMNA